MHWADNCISIYNLYRVKLNKSLNVLYQLPGISKVFFSCNKLICGIANFKYQNVSQILNNDDVPVNPLDLSNINNVLMLCNCFFSFNIPSNILSERWIFCTANEIHLVNTNLLSDAKNLQVIKFFLSLKIFYLLSKITWS